MGRSAIRAADGRVGSDAAGVGSDATKDSHPTRLAIARRFATGVLPDALWLATLPMKGREGVYLPAPLGPTRPTFSALRMTAEASMKTIWWPFCLEILST